MCGFLVCELFVADLTARCNRGQQCRSGAVGELFAARVGKPRARAGVRNGVSALLQGAVALTMCASELERWHGGGVVSRCVIWTNMFHGKLMTAVFPLKSKKWELN